MADSRAEGNFFAALVSNANSNVARGTCSWHGIEGVFSRHTSLGATYRSAEGLKSQSGPHSLLYPSCLVSAIVETNVFVLKRVTNWWNCCWALGGSSVPTQCVSLLVTYSSGLPAVLAPLLQVASYSVSFSILKKFLIFAKQCDADFANSACSCLRAPQALEDGRIVARIAAVCRRDGRYWHA